MADQPLTYTVDTILGEGSTSLVVLARPNAGERRVVVKVLHRSLVEHREILARTRDEARLLAMIPHPNIVAVEALVAHHGHPLVVMEHVDGLDLGVLLRAHLEPLPPLAAAEVVRRTALALDAANTAPNPSDPSAPLRVVHRDIKPSNLLLSVTGEVKVLDFGLARAEFATREVRTDGFVLGSMGFVAPERYDAPQATAAVDIYALGVTWFQLLTARTLVVPRARERHDAERDKQLDRMPLADVPDALAAEIRATIREMTAYDPEMRPSAREVSARIEALAPPLDLAELAVARITAARARHPPIDPRSHPAWREVAFLEEPEQEPRPLSWFARALRWRGER